MNRLSVVVGEFFRSEAGKHVAIVVALIVTSLLISTASYYHAQHLALPWVKSLQPQYKLQETTTRGFAKYQEYHRIHWLLVLKTTLVRLAVG